MPDLTLSPTIDAFLAGTPDAGQQTTIKNSLSLGNVDNTSDANKPVSTATQTALDLKLDLAGGTMTGSVDMGAFNITNVTDISANNDISSYTMDAAGGFTTYGLPAYFPLGVDLAYQDISNANNVYAYDIYGNSIDAGSGFTTSANSAYFPYGVYYLPTAVSSLPSPNEGYVNYVNDATSPVIGSAVVGGGAAKCLVCHNGTDWIVTSIL